MSGLPAGNSLSLHAQGIVSGLKSKVELRGDFNGIRAQCLTGNAAAHNTMPVDQTPGPFRTGSLESGLVSVHVRGFKRSHSASVNCGNICSWRGVYPMHHVRVILWTVAMAYTGFLLTGQGRTFNSLSITEAFLGALTGFLLAIMFTLRERRRQRPALVAYSTEQIFPNWVISRENRGSHPKPKR